jgi:tetratricopeptide (TPR) repeat protein
MAVGLLPLLLLAVVEVALRVVGFGYPTDFFVKASANGQTVWIDNARFGWRFFPRHMARTPMAQRVPLSKGEGFIRIFVLGESAAEGDPAPAFGFSRILKVLLEEHDPGHRYEVINVAVTAINSHAIRSIARQCARMEGDYWIVYAGHNEAVGSFGPATVFGARLPSLALIRATLLLKSTRIGQLLEQALQPTDRGGGWEGMEMFLEQQIHPDDARLRSMYAHFQRNLEAVARYGRKSGARVLLSSMPANLADCPPFGSLNAPGLADTELADWTRFHERGVELEANGRTAEALQWFQQAAEIDPTHAALQFRLGRCELKLGRWTEARDSFQRALDADSLRFRADSRLNAIIAWVAGQEGVSFIDSRAILAEASPRGLPGEESFYEHVHLTFMGNYLLARTFAEAIAENLLNRGPAMGAEWLDVARCAELLAFTEWDQREVYQAVLRRMARPPFTHQLDHARRMQRYQERVAQLGVKLDRQGFQEVESVYQAALVRSPADRFLHQNMASRLAEQGRLSEAISHLEQVMELLPHYPRTYWALGNLLVEAGNYDEARSRFEQALRRQPGLANAIHGLGLVELYRGNYAEAVILFTEVIEKETDHVDAYYNRGIALSRKGEVEAAMLSYEQALAIQPDHDRAHTNLGNLLVRQRQYAKALEHFHQAILIQPNRASYHNNLGTALAQSGDIAQAILPFREAIRLDPEFAQARFNLGNAYVHGGRVEEAAIEFKTALDIQPDFAPARQALSKLVQGRHGSQPGPPK